MEVNGGQFRSFRISFAYFQILQSRPIFASFVYFAVKTISFPLAK